MPPPALLVAASTSSDEILPKSPLQKVAETHGLGHLELCAGCDCELAQPETAPSPLPIPCEGCDCGLVELQKAASEGTVAKTDVTELLASLKMDHSNFVVSPRKAKAVEAGACDACPHCSDTCGDSACVSCASKVPPNPKCGKPVYTMCQVQRHNTYVSAVHCTTLCPLIHHHAPHMAIHPHAHMAIH